MQALAVASRDGTKIAFDRLGDGPPLILVDGALCSRAFGPMGALAPVLAPHFTVFTYDRRGRGESGDTQPYAVAREVEDIEALINEAGGSAFVYGVSSGAALALEAAARDLNIVKLAIFEPPLDPDDGGNAAFEEYKRQVADMLAEGRPGDAVAFFLADMMPPEALKEMRHGPIWPIVEAVGPTLAYDNAVLGDGSVPVERAASISIPTLVIHGGESVSSFQQAARVLANAIPNAERRVLEGYTLQAPPELVAPVLIDFFAG